MEKRLGGTGDQRKNRTLLNSTTILKKNPGDLRRLTVIGTSVKNYQLKLVGKACNNNYSNNDPQRLGKRAERVENRTS